MQNLSHHHLFISVSFFFYDQLIDNLKLIYFCVKFLKIVSNFMQTQAVIILLMKVVPRSIFKTGFRDGSNK